jgi:hypothetical protein
MTNHRQGIAYGKMIPLIKPLHTTTFKLRRNIQ